MKKNYLIFGILAALCVTACASAAASGSTSAPASAAAVSGGIGPDFSQIKGKNWNLIQVQINGKDTGFDRSALVSEGFSDSFTLTFDDERLSGRGAPNRYFSDYTLGGNQEITVKLIASTKMASFNEPQSLKEHDFFQYLQNIDKWNLLNDNLELSGPEAALIFAPGDK